MTTRCKSRYKHHASRRLLLLDVCQTSAEFCSWINPYFFFVEDCVIYFHRGLNQGLLIIIPQVGPVIVKDGGFWWHDSYTSSIRFRITRESWVNVLSSLLYTLTPLRSTPPSLISSLIYLLSLHFLLSLPSLLFLPLSLSFIPSFSLSLSLSFSLFP